VKKFTTWNPKKPIIILQLGVSYLCNY